MSVNLTFQNCPRRRNPWLGLNLTMAGCLDFSGFFILMIQANMWMFWPIEIKQNWGTVTMGLHVVWMIFLLGGSSHLVSGL